MANRDTGDWLRMASLDNEGSGRTPYGVWVSKVAGKSRRKPTFHLAAGLTADGMRMSGKAQLAPGQRLRLQLIVENEPTVLALEAEVLSSSKTDHCLRFVNIDERSAQFLSELLEEASAVSSSG